VFVPSFFMTGVTRALFVPLTLSVGFAMIASYLLSFTLVPVLARRTLKAEPEHGGPFDRLREAYGALLRRLLDVRWLALAGYAAAAGAVLLLLAPVLGRELFPRVDLGQMQLRLRAPAGTRIERTEALTQQTLRAIQEAAGPGNVAITLCYIGTQPASYPVNTIHLWTSGPHEAVMRVALKPGAPVRMAALEERLREELPRKFPGATFSFEPGDVISQIMNYGAPTPIEVVTAGPDLAADLSHAQKLMAALKEIPSLRDLQFAQALEYPSLNVDVDRERAGQLGVTVEQVGRALVAGTSSTRFIAPNYWRDPASGTAYQVQVEIPQPLVNSPEDVENIPAMPSGAAGPYVRDLARVAYGSVVGQYDRYNQQRMVTISANVAGEDLGRAAARVEQAIRRVGDAPRGVTVTVRGQVATMRQTLGSLQIGVGLAVIVIFLMLAANFESFVLSLVVLSTIPAALSGVVLMLLATGTTANVQSFMGTIMALGVAVANAILLVTFAEQARRGGASPLEAALEGARTRLRPILMTSCAMIAGMVPLALALGQGAEQTAPLGRAVIGGLIAATAATLFVLPAVFAVATRKEK
jgi:multidrug efflux pump subunit AcrB